MTGELSTPDRQGPPVTPTAVALGTLGLLLVFPPSRSPAVLGPAAFLVAVAFVAGLVRTGTPSAAVGWFLGTFVFLCIVAASLLWAGESLWLAALGVVVASATLSFGLHRYELVILGKVGSEQS